MRLIPWTCLLAIAAAALTAANARADDLYNLRGPGTVKGQVTVNKTVFKIKEGAMTIKIMGMTIDATQSLTSTGEEEVRVTAVADGQPTKTQTKVIREQAETVMTINGQENKDKKAGDLEGEVIISERGKDGKWKHTLVDTKPTDKQKSELERRPGADNQADIYPEKKIAAGHIWSVDATVLQRILGGSITDLKGKVKFKFLRVEDVDGEECAVIESSGSITGIAKTDEGELNVEFDIKGITFRSLKSGIDLKDEAEGTMRMSGKIKTNGVMADVDLKGPIVIHGRTKLKVAKKLEE